MSNKLVIFFEWAIIVSLIYFIIIPDWNKFPVVKDYFALVVIAELGFDLYLRLKDKI
jgi:hypothetical protein